MCHYLVIICYPFRNTWHYGRITSFVLILEKKMNVISNKYVVKIRRFLSKSTDIIPHQFYVCQFEICPCGHKTSESEFWFTVFYDHKAWSCDFFAGGSFVRDICCTVVINCIGILPDCTRYSLQVCPLWNKTFGN